MAKYEISDHYDGKQFQNLKPTEYKSFLSVLKWKFTSDAESWQDIVDVNNYDLPILTPDQAAVTWINHASFLIQTKGVTIVTDPILSERASPFSFLGPKRVRPPGQDLEKLEKLDVVLISHNHYDHLDIEGLKRLEKKFHPLMIVPLGDKELLVDAGIKNVQEKDWWDEVRVKDVNITFLPSQHWSARGLFDKGRSLWGSYMIDDSIHKIYFAGDTGYGEHFKLIQNRVGSPDVALLPIGAYEPRWFMKDHHMNPEDAVAAHIDLGSKKSIGMHYGTFQLTDEKIDEPVKDLAIAREKHKIPADVFGVLDAGETYTLLSR